jgi:hypothetical protein
MDMPRNFLLASDFDQTLSFNDSGVVLSELIGFHSFHDKVNLTACTEGQCRLLDNIIQDSVHASGFSQLSKGENEETYR